MTQQDEDGNGRVDRLLPPREQWKRTTAAMGRMFLWLLVSLLIVVGVLILGEEWHG